MKKGWISLFILCCGFAGSAQYDSLALIREAGTKLKSRTATVSEILTDKKYLRVHPATDFRKIIEDNCTSAVLKITTPEEPGKKIRVVASVTDKEGKPVAGALVYLYQTDYRGWYAADAPHVLLYEGDMRHARLFGYVRTDINGKFELHTVKPSGYPKSDLPAHIHVHINKDGYKQYVTEFLFDDDDRLVGKIREQAIQNRFIISKPEKVALPFVQQFSYNLVVGKQ